MYAQSFPISPVFRYTPEFATDQSDGFKKLNKPLILKNSATMFFYNIKHLYCALIKWLTGKCSSRYNYNMIACLFFRLLQLCHYGFLIYGSPIDKIDVSINYF